MGLPRPSQHAVDEGLAVDGVHDRAAHAHVVERLLLVVDAPGCPCRAVSPIATVKRLSAWNCFRLCSAPKRGMPSMSPASSAATCAAGSLMKRKVTLLILMARRVAVAGPLAQRDRRALLPVVELERAGADRLGRGGGRALRARGSRPCSRPGGTASWRRRCSASGSPCAGRRRDAGRCCRTPPSWPCWCEPSALARSKLNFTAAASKGSPSWNLTPLRSLKV